MEKLSSKIKKTKFKEDEALEKAKEKVFPRIMIEDENDQKRLLLKSDYETASEFNPDFHSDNEPPADKVHEERLICKRKEFRIYKKIINVGKKGDMPSKYNKICYKFKKTGFENLEENCLEDEEFVTHQMGIDVEELTEIKMLCLQNMKKGELSSFRIELIEFDKAKQQRNLVGEHFLQFHVRDWETIYDIYGDFHCMKTVMKKGNGYERLKVSDEPQLSVCLKSNLGLSDEVVLFKKEFNGEEQVLENTPSSVQELVTNMKEGEMSQIEIRKDFFEEFEQDPQFLKEIMEIYGREVDGGKSGYCVVAILHLSKLVKVEDIFSDETVFKKSIMGSYSTAQPDLHSRIYFDFKIMINTGEVVYNGLENQIQAVPKNDTNFKFYEESTCQKNFLDDYSLSRAMRHALRSAKKLEKFELVIKDEAKIKDGLEREMILKAKPGQEIKELLPLKYEVKVYTFSLGDNAYTMGISDKKKCFADRKPVVVKMIKSKNYKRALKLLTFVRDILEMVISYFNS